jgi:hypothetical protein
MNYAEALVVADLALACEPVAPTGADLELVFRLNPGLDKTGLAESFGSVYVDGDVRVIVSDDGHGYLVYNDRAYFIPAESEDDLTLLSAPL